LNIVLSGCILSVGFVDEIPEALCAICSRDLKRKKENPREACPAELHDAKR
jgi:hypothetical protein